MSKMNPLFVDSTLFHGDLIQSHIELKGILPHAADEVFLVLTNHQGITRRIPMRWTEDGAFEARAHVHHQTLIHLRFVVEQNGQPLFQSAAVAERAQYALVREWQPTFDEPLLKTGDCVETISPRVDPSVAWARESALSVRSLIDKWGL